MRLDYFSWWLVACCVGVSGCGAPPATRHDDTAMTALDVEAWSGSALAASGQAAVDGPEASRPDTPIELAGGAHFRSIVALSQVAPPPQPATPPDSVPVARCSVYSMRATRTGLEEGNLSVDCPGRGVADVRLEGFPFHAVEEPRSAHLRVALAGASLTTTGDTSTQARDHVEVLVTTEAGTVRDVVGVPPWPPPGAEEQELPRGSPPSHVGELWEALMFPGRYAAVPARVAARNASVGADR